MKTITDQGIDINKRFFEAIEELKKRHEIRGLQTFTRQYNINRWNLVTVRDNPTIYQIKPEYLSFLVEGYGISANWLLTGRGKMMRACPKPNKEEDKNLKVSTL